MDGLMAPFAIGLWFLHHHSGGFGFVTTLQMMSSRNGVRTLSHAQRSAC